MTPLKKKCVFSHSWRCYSSSFKSQIVNFQNETPSNQEKTLTRCRSIANLNKCNAFVHLFPQGNNNNKNNKNSEHSSTLHNVPYALKDAFTTCATAENEAPTTMASRMLKNFYSSYDSFVYDTLSNKCHAQCMGKTNLDEFGMGGGTTYSLFGATRNPWNTEYIAGGSSGGSAASVAEGSALFSIGTDTGGSVRQPASYCGIVGFKPGYGRISRFGMISFASSLDTAGIFSKYIYDSVLVYDELIKYGQPLKENTFPNDNSAQYTNDTEPLAPKLQDFNVESECKQLRVGIPVEYLLDELQPEILDMWQLAMDKLKQAGATVEYISLPHTKYALPAYYIIAPAEASSNLSRYDGIRYGYNYKKDGLTQGETHSTHTEDSYAINRTNGFGEEVKRRILAGTFALSMDKYDTFFKRAQQTRTLIAKDFHETLKFNADEEDHKYDIILTPTVPTSSIKLADYCKLNPVDIYTNDIFTIPASLAGLPAASIPSAISQKNGMPLGLQVIGATEWNTIRGAFILEHLCEFKHLNE